MSQKIGDSKFVTSVCCLVQMRHKKRRFKNILFPHKMGEDCTSEFRRELSRGWTPKTAVVEEETNKTIKKLFVNLTIKT